MYIPVNRKLKKSRNTNKETTEFDEIKKIRDRRGNDPKTINVT